MANAYPTLDDVLQLSGEGGRFLKPVKMLQQKYPLLKMLPMIECNKTDSHEFAFDYSLPDPTYRIYNQGIYSTDGENGSTEEKTTMLSDRMAIDEDAAELNGNKVQFLENKAYQHLESIYQEIERGFFYNTLAANPNRFNGLSTRYNTLNSMESDNIVTHTGSPSGSDQTSIWLVVASPESIYTVYPRGTPGGLRAKELPIPTLVDDADGAQFRAIVVDWIWRIGLCVQDWRQAARLCNIDTSAISATAYDLVPGMTKLWHRVENLQQGQAAFFMNRDTHETLDLQCQNNSKQVAIEKYVEEGVPRTSFRGVPIYITDAITNTEAVVS